LKKLQAAKAKRVEPLRRHIILAISRTSLKQRQLEAVNAAELMLKRALVLRPRRQFEKPLKQFAPDRAERALRNHALWIRLAFASHLGGDDCTALLQQMVEEEKEAN